MEFPGYEPKREPDTVLDYRPRLRGRVAALPAASLHALPALLAELTRAAEAAAASPGRTVRGNMLLGEPPEMYVPSDEELLASEIGDRIARVVASEPGGRVRAMLGGPLTVSYRAFRFSHADVMGSGRTFTADDRGLVRLDA
jgi:hypothetical protein